jgi:hypothetical protein
MAKPASKSVAAGATPDYPAFLAALKERILNARITAARAINHELVLLYWDIGRGIVEKQRLLGWGESVIDRVSADLRAAFPDSSGFSPRNLRDMKRFYVAYENPLIWRRVVANLAGTAKVGDSAIWPQAVAKLEAGEDEVEILRKLVAEIPWGHHRFILDKLNDPAARIYYLRATESEPADLCGIRNAKPLISPFPLSIQPGGLPASSRGLSQRYPWTTFRKAPHPEGCARNPEKPKSPAFQISDAAARYWPALPAMRPPRAIKKL